MFFALFLLVALSIWMYFLNKKQGGPYNLSWMPIVLVSVVLAFYLIDVKSAIKVFVLPIALLPLVLVFGFRGEKFHWLRVPIGLGVWHLLLLSTGYFKGDYPVAFMLTILWGLPAAMFAGYFGEPFRRDRFKPDNILEELKALNENKVIRLKTIGFIFASINMAFPMIIMSLIQSLELIGLLLKYVLGVAVVIGIIVLINRAGKPYAKKSNTDHLGNEEAVAASVNVANKAGGILAGEVNGQELRVSIEDRAVVVGPPGTGKTAFLVSQLLDWANSGRSFVCMDIKPEIYGIAKKALEAISYTPTTRRNKPASVTTCLMISMALNR